MKEVAAIAKGVAEKTKAGDPRAEGTTIGPVVSRIQWDKIQGLIQKGIEEGATLVAGGPGRPEGLNKGFYVRPTVFADVTNDMTIAREEIFGPVLSIMGDKDEADAVKIANDTPYGLAGYVSGRTPSSAPARSAARSAPATSTSTACRTTAPRRSAATSSPATAASGASSASRSISRSRRSPATTPRDRHSEFKTPERVHPAPAFLLCASAREKFKAIDLGVAPEEAAQHIHRSLCGTSPNAVVSSDLIKSRPQIAHLGAHLRSTPSGAQSPRHLRRKVSAWPFREEFPLEHRGAQVSFP